MTLIFSLREISDYVINKLGLLKGCLERTDRGITTDTSQLHPSNYIERVLGVGCCWKFKYPVNKCCQKVSVMTCIAKNEHFYFSYNYKRSVTFQCETFFSQILIIVCSIRDSPVILLSHLRVLTMISTMSS